MKVPEASQLNRHRSNAIVMTSSRKNAFPLFAHFSLRSKEFVGLSASVVLIPALPRSL